LRAGAFASVEVPGSLMIGRGKLLMGKYRLVSFLLLVILLVPAGSLRAQGIQGMMETRELVDVPTAGLLPKGKFDIEIRMQRGGGVLSRISMGVLDRLLLGVSYGGSGIVGDQAVEWNPRPEVLVKYRLFDETMPLPALVIGFDSQGIGSYHQGFERYDIKSRGFFLVASKNYRFLGRMGFHGGINYSLERSDGDKDLNLFAGIDKSVNPEISLVVEYDAALNDSRKDGVFGEGLGYLNAGLRWHISQGLSIELDMKDLLRNFWQSKYPNREIRIIYIEAF